MMIYKLDDNIIRIVQKRLPPSFVLNKATNYAFKISQGFFWCLLIMEEPPGIPYFMKYCGISDIYSLCFPVSLTYVINETYISDYYPVRNYQYMYDYVWKLFCTDIFL